MKTFAFFVFVGCCLTSISAFAQTPKQIEADLLRSLNKINYWNRKTLPDNKEINFNLLSKANDDLEKKLKYYGKRNSPIINKVFKDLGGLISDDGFLRIFTWDTNMGGTQHIFENVILYKSGKQTDFSVDKTSNKGSYVYAYDKLYSLIIGNKIYYIATYYGIFDLYMRAEGIIMFSIENGRLNKADIIKTASRITNHLYYSYNQNESNEDVMGDNTLEYDSKDTTITFPVIDTDGHQTDTAITYKFTGKYFEKVKN
jgi:hypothetical protein